MNKITGIVTQSLSSSETRKMIGQSTTIKGVVHRVRKIGGINFVVINDHEKFTQCVIEPAKSQIAEESYREGNHVAITGTVREESRAPGGYELDMQSCLILSATTETPPFALNRKNLDIDLSTNLDFRPISLRHPKQAAIFRIQAAIAQLFREALQGVGFTEIFSPKIVFAGAEGGANIFKVKYFDREVFLAQSPQFYKQMMVGVYGRVFEVAPVFRAEPHDTARHLNEYISMDMEMGYINGFEDIMQMETYVLKHIFRRLPEVCEIELDLLKTEVPVINTIPTIKFSEAQEIAKRHHGSGMRDDLDATSEQLVCKWIAKETDSCLVFVTHYPTSVRPVYAMEDPENTEETLSFDLLMHGLEITTGGQRIHNYEEQVAKMKRKGYKPEDFASYLMIHKYGMPPHGGLGLGLERLTMQLLGLSSLKETSLFPRTVNRIAP